MNDPFLTTKEIAATWKRSLRWAYALRRLGLQMPGGVARQSEIEAFIRENPSPTTAERRVSVASCKNLQGIANRAD